MNTTLVTVYRAHINSRKRRLNFLILGVTTRKTYRATVDLLELLNDIELFRTTYAPSLAAVTFQPADLLGATVTVAPWFS